MKSIKNIVFAALLTFSFSLSTLVAQNDTMYIMKDGAVVGIYNVNTEVDSVVFYNPSLNITTIKDYDGNFYNTVTINNKVWMASNLKTTKYNDGTAITTMKWPNNNETYKEPYGGLYNIATVTNSKLCPTNWHVSTFDDWNTLISYLGGLTVAGGKLKEIGNTHWTNNQGANNSTGFTAIAAGYVNGTTPMFLNNIGYWHCADGTNYIRINNYGAGIEKATNSNQDIFFAVRCVKD